jgi:hypothetical protein
MPHTFFTLIRFPVQELGEADIGKAVIIKSTAISGIGLFITPAEYPSPVCPANSDKAEDGGIMA